MWITAIKRDEGETFKIKQGSTYVCSRHFHESDYITGSDSGLLALDNFAPGRRLKVNSVPSRFEWNNWGLPTRESVYKRVNKRMVDREISPDLPSEQTQLWVAMEELSALVVREHGYGTAPTPGRPMTFFTLKMLLYLPMVAINIQAVFNIRTLHRPTFFCVIQVRWMLLLNAYSN